MCDTYNGWTNRETWATGLHLSNDHDVFRATAELVEEASYPARALEEFVLWWVESFYAGEIVPDWVRLMASDVGSFYRVDWEEVAVSLSDS